MVLSPPAPLGKTVEASPPLAGAALAVMTTARTDRVALELGSALAPLVLQ
jgi:hypothetical protein